MTTIPNDTDLALPPDEEAALGATHATAEEYVEVTPEPKVVYQTDESGFLVGPTLADLSPLDEEAVWLIPGGCVEASPPAEIPAGQRPRWVDGAWALEAYTLDEQGAAPDASETAAPLDLRRYYQGLAERGIVSWTSAEQAVGAREIPPELEGYFAALPESARPRERLRVRAAEAFLPTDPYVLFAAAAEEWTDSELQAFWAECRAL